MLVLITFAFIAGLVTVLSPCILPLLPIILSTTTETGEYSRKKPLGVILGFILSFSFFTLFLSSLVKATGINPNGLRLISVYIIGGFGLSFLIPKFQVLLENAFSFVTNLLPSKKSGSGFGSGIVVGLSLGLLWTPCVGPILASVISLAIIGNVNSDAILITVAYAMGTALPMFAIMAGGRNLLKQNPWLTKNTATIQKVFGVLMILTAVGIATGADKKFQVFVLNTFPEYGLGLTKFEDNNLVKKSLENLQDSNTETTAPSDLKYNLQKGPKAPELILGGQWFNTSTPLKLSELRGKVVLIDFWTYSCINCIRTLPYLKTWWEKYEKDGLVIIGVHSPEFEFEKSPHNLSQSINDFELKYPIMQDNDFSTWKAYNNRYWPAKYLIDHEGNVRYYHYGEGNYNETEKAIQELLVAKGSALNNLQINNPVQKDNPIRTRETYLGYARLESLSSPEFPIVGKKINFSTPELVPINTFALAGEWTMSAEYVEGYAGSTLTLNYAGQLVYLVLGNGGSTAKIKVYVDGTQKYFGADSINGEVTVDAERLYEIVNSLEPGKHLLRIEIIQGTIKAFAFTFG